MELRSTSSTAAPPSVRLIGDVACPWTYLTLISLRRAFGADLVLNWHPFLLDPRDLRRQRTGLIEAVNRYARSLDAEFVAASLAQPVDSRLAQGAILAAGPDGAAAAAALFRRRFAEGAALAEGEAMAAALAGALGAGRAEAIVARAPDFAATVVRSDRLARAAGVTEVPVVVVARAYAIAGLQPPEAFSALAELAEIERH